MSGDPSMSLAAFRDYILGAVRSVFTSAAKSGQELAPVAFIVTSKGVAVTPVHQFMRSDEGKDKLMAVLADVAAHKDVLGIATVTEIWTANATSAAVKADDFVRPKDRPDRGEAALVRIEFRGADPEIWMAAIRNDNDTRTLAEFDSRPIDGGRMAAALFSESPVVH